MYVVENKINEKCIIFVKNEGLNDSKSICNSAKGKSEVHNKRERLQRNFN